ncbi:hypothetical protein QUF80_16605 [Desulfococcaceae bacterium HSG8]|nr:hypothetical protein [Desulfococcaceae bacterium HSG8]
MQHSSENMKTDVSVSLPIFKAADHLAKKLGVSMAELYTLALTSYMAKYQENITETLDRVYEHESSAIEPVLANAQTVSLGEESW